MSYVYDASAIEVLSGLEPVRKRPGMFTDTSRPNHLAQEVIDNSVDEAITGYARAIEVTLYQDGSLAVKDDGRGMPVDLHPEEQVPGVEVILTRLHAGGKFSLKNYRFSGGLHGVGVSVVNALSSRLEVCLTPVRRCVFGLIQRISRPHSLPSHGCVIFCVPRPFSVQGYGCVSAMKTLESTWSGAIRRGSRPISSKPCRTSLCSLKSLLWGVWKGRRKS